MGALRRAAETLGKPDWRAVLGYVADLHARCVHPARPPFPHPWEEIGPGYCYGPAFGHWDIVHAVLDVVAFEPEHARMQLENNLAAQQEDGLVPGSIWLRGDKAEWDSAAGHPPVWPFAAAELPQRLERWFEALVRQIGWFETHRKADECGFFYTDILTHDWESGVDEGIRFLDVRTGPQACVDATAHVFALYDFAARWARQLGRDAAPFEAHAAELRGFIQNELFVDETGFFHDIWAVRDPAVRCLAFEGMWPVVVGAATAEQAHRVVHDNLLDPARFFSRHPITTVSQDDARFELRCWRGPAWNSMTYWAARGCARYGFNAAGASLLERALDDSAAQFARTGTVWEFYHPDGGRPEDVQRKPHTPFNTPCRDYLGH
ncbi:MAG: glycoside hydrolase, partial [Candidatus Hydrogenedentes bacterium]|nr:glycoside hydrolase [Candidatus Hydrogenedentota bacterium]